MPKSRRKSDWYHPKRNGRSLISGIGDPRFIKNNGRVFDISEYSMISFETFKISPNYYEIRERAIFDHIVHERLIVRDLPSREKAEHYIKGLFPINRNKEARSARAERIRWMEEEAIPRAELAAEKRRRYASRQTFARSSDGKRVQKSSEVREDQAKRLTGARKKLRQLKTDLRRAIKAQG